MRTSEWAIVVMACVLAAAAISGTNAITCLNEQGSPVDWWVMIKTPYMNGNSDPNVASGFGYAYADANAQSLRLTAKRLDTNTQGALGSTLGQIYSASPSNTAWFMYNDEPPTGTASSDYGHTKGDVAFNKNGGFWLIHSVPRFPADPSSTYSYPDNEKDYGQSFLCMSFNLDMFNDVGNAFLLNRPFIYSQNLPSTLASLVPSFYSVSQKQWITKVAASNASTLFTSGGAAFTVFSKNAKWADNLYSALVGPTIGSSLLVESWMNGAISNKMPTFCAGTGNYQYSTINVRQVAVSSSVSWPETKDHSKWAITTGSSRKVWCIGDTNRQFSQAKRGGGTACASISGIWTSLNGMVASADQC